MKILYAEDEKQLSMAVTEILKMENYEVDTVYDGQEALEHLKKGSYDAAVLDIMMPGMDGVEVLKNMRKNHDYTPVMLLTAKTQVEDRVGGLRTGADDYLGKPFDIRELLARLESMIRRRVDYQDTLLSLENISLNCKTYELTSEISTLQLSSSESMLLSYFMKKPGFLFETETLRQEIFPDDSSVSAVVLYLSYLKNKLNQLRSKVNIREKEGKYYLG